MTTIGQKIDDYVKDVIDHLLITSASPGFTNVVKKKVSDPGLIRSIDVEIEKITGKAKAPDKLRTAAQIEKRFRDFMDNLEKTPSGRGTVTGTSLKVLLTAQLGVTGARNALSLLTNPKRAIAGHVMSKNFLTGTHVLGQGPKGFGNLNATSIMKAAGIVTLIFAILMSRPFIERITAMMTKRGGIFDKTFRMKTNTLQNSLRTREQQQSIRSGFTQVVFTTNAGTVDPRDAYNTYEQTIHDEVRLTNLRNIRVPGNILP